MHLFRAADKYVLEGLSQWCAYYVRVYLTHANCVQTIQVRGMCV